MWPALGLECRKAPGKGPRDLLKLRALWNPWRCYSSSSQAQLPSQTAWWFTGIPSVEFSSVQLLSCVWLFATPWTAARQASLSITNSRSLLKLMSIESVMPSNQLILCCPLLLLPSIFPSIRVFSNESALCIMWPNYWSFSYNIRPSSEHLGLISFRMDWLDLLAVQGTLKSLLQHHSSKASILQCSAFFTVQLSNPYMTIGKTIALTRRTFVGKVMSLLFNMLPRLVITFFPGSKRLLISWLQSPLVSYKSAVGLPLGLAALDGGQCGTWGSFWGLRVWAWGSTCPSWSANGILQGWGDQLWILVSGRLSGLPSKNTARELKSTKHFPSRSVLPRSYPGKSA